MNFLFEMSTNGYKVYHSFALELKKKYPNSKFGVIRADIPAQKFLKNQTEIQYYFFTENLLSSLSDLSFDKSQNKLINNLDNIDQKILDEFEVIIPEKSLWKIIASDRVLGRNFINHTVGWENEIGKNKELILKILSFKIKTIEKVFLDYKPNYFFPQIGGGSVDTHIYYYLSKKYNTNYLVHQSARIKNFFSFTDNLNLSFPKINSDTIIKLQNKNYKTSIDANKLYSEIMNDIFGNIFTEKIKLRKNLLFKFKIILKILYDSFAFIIKGKKNFVNVNLFTKFIYKRIKYITLLNLQQIFYGKLGSEIKKNQKYIFFPLHFTPEYSTAIQATVFQNQYFLIYLLSISIPSDHILILKEHPAMLSRRVRQKSFFNAIDKLPNVQFVPTDKANKELILNSSIVVVITGTSGWEAILAGKPVINFAEHIYDILGLSTTVNDINKLSQIIYDKINLNRENNDNNREHKIKCFLDSVLENTFELTHPKEALFEEGLNYKYKISGRELFYGFEKYIKKNNLI